MSKSFEELLHEKLSRQRESGLIRKLNRGAESLIDFSSNDYLGLARSQALFDKVRDYSFSGHNLNGSTGSRLLTGNSGFIEETEEFLSRVFRCEKGLICNSGYSANLAVLSAIPQKDDTIIYDELAHASIKDGARMSLAKRFSFRHNDVQDLEAKIRRSAGRIFIAIESIYSMDGDHSPLADICALAKKYDACIILDEAHSTGLCMENGAGYAVRENLHDQVDIRIYTFGKATGAHGAFVAGKNALIDFLINFSRPFIYTTALSPHSVVQIRCAFEFLKEHPELQSQLTNNIEHYNRETGFIRNRTDSMSAIQTVIFEGNENVRRASKMFIDHGLDIRPILSPTVPKGRERIRICLHAFNSEKEIGSLIGLLREMPLPDIA
jgi:8-amino-7-oxononanoate synthase